MPRYSPPYDPAMKNYFIQLGKKCRAIRKSKKMTQGEIAQKAGVHPRTYQSVEAGQVVSLHTVLRVARALGISISDIV